MINVTKDIFIEGNLIEKSKIKLHYKGKFTVEYSNEVFVICGYGPGWKNIIEQKMTWVGDGFSVELDLVSSGVLNFCFRNDYGSWDNNNGNDYSVEVKEYIKPVIEENVIKVEEPKIINETKKVDEVESFSEIASVVEEVADTEIKSIEKEELKHESIIPETINVQETIKEEVKVEEKKTSYEPKHEIKKEVKREKFTKKEEKNKNKKNKKDRYKKKFEQKDTTSKLENIVRRSKVVTDGEDSLFDYINNSKEYIDYNVAFKNLVEEGNEERAKEKVKEEVKVKKENPRKVRNRRKKKRNKARRLVRLICILILLGCVIYAGVRYAQVLNVKNETNALLDVKIDETKINEEEEINERMLQVQELGKEYPDLKGWLEVKDTVINFPVMQGKDNDFYIKHDYKQEKSKWGALFLDKDFDWEKPSSNLLIYGHNFSDGLMFADLLKYRDEEFYKTHKTIRFTTAEEDAEYEIISVFNSRVYYKHETDVFRYYFFVDAENQEEYDEFVKNAKEASIHDIEATAEYGDQLITLSTCDYTQEDGRFVVVARKITEWYR